MSTPSGPPQPAPDAVGLTSLLRDYGALWDITRTPRGFTARRRRHSAPPVVLSAETTPGLRELLEHGYDPGILAALMRDFAEFEIERIDPGSEWVAVSHGHHPAPVVAAADLDSLRGKLSRAQDGKPADAKPGHH